jgi:hypothetical protein
MGKTTLYFWEVDLGHKHKLGRKTDQKHNEKVAKLK